MNAYELADDLENSNGLQYITKVGLVSLSAQMLRQQAEKISNMEAWENKYLDKIEELEKRCLDLGFSEAYADKATEVTEDLLLDRIAELELQLFKVTNRTIATRKKLSKLKKEKIRSYDNGYEDGQKSYTQLSTQLHPIENDK
jgi:hypothetical protein